MKLVRMGIVVSLVTMLLLIVLVSCVKIDTLHDEPGNPSPTDGAVGVSITPTLKWETKYKWPFEVYLSSDPKAVEKELESAQISSDSTENQCKINVPLEYNTKYYWKVVFKTFGVKMMESPVWSFTTGSPLSLEIPDQMVNEGDTLELNLLDFVSGATSGVLTFTKISGVGTVTGNTYIYSPDYEASGAYKVIIKAADSASEATDDFIITVKNVNRAPVLNIPDQTVSEGATLTLDLTEYANDDDGDTLSFELVEGTGTIVGTRYMYKANYDASGTYIVEIKVSDGMGGEATDTFTLVVFNVNRIPIWNISDVFNMLENTTLTLKLTDYASDPDGDSLTFRLVSGVGRVDGDTYTFTAGYDASGTYEVVLGASDGSAEATAGFRIEVGNVNRLPMIDLPDEWIINEITNLVLNLMEYASDPDGDVLSFELVEGTGTIIGTQYIFEPDYDSSGTYRIEIKVTDGMGGEATDVFTLKVLNVNRIPRIDVPDFDDLLEGLKFTIDLTDYATDDDGDELTFELLSEEGTIVGSIFIYEPDYDASGTHVVEVKVSDGMGGEATDVFTLKVWNVNRAPVWDQIAIQTINEGLTFTLDLSQYASDPDGDLLTFSLVSGVGSIDGSIYSFTAGYDAAGSYEIVVAASDDSAESTTSFWLEVFDVNQPPESVLLLNPLDKATGVPTTVTFMWQATDPDNDDLVYDLYLADNPDIFTLVAANISTSTFEKSGLSYETTYYWKVVAKDGKGGVATSTVYSFTTISQGNNAPSTPTALYPSDGATDVPTNVTLRWWATDPDGDPIVYDVYFGTNKDSLQKILSDTPSTSTEQSSLFYATTYYWKVVAKDGKGGIATSTIWSFTTKASPNSPPNQPVAISPEDGATDVPTKTTLSWACSDPDGDQLEYDLYFGTDQQSLALLASGLSVNTYSLSDLAYGTTYYWQVVARDGKGGAATSSVWSFTTASTPTQGLTTQWSVILGGTAYEQAMSIARVSDGYIVAGYTGSNDGDVSGNHGEEDFWVLKLSTDGTVTWDKLYGGSGSEMAWDVMLTADGGYVVVGYSTSSQDGDVMDSNNGQEDVWVIKLDSTGNILWQKLIGSSGSDVSMSVCEVCDTNTLSYYYVVAGYVEAGDGDVNAATHGGTDTWLVKLSATTGDIVAQAVLGGSGDEVAYSIKPTSDGGYIVVGSTTSDNSGDVGSNNGGTDFWVVKLDSDFNIQWSECYGGVYDDGALDVEVVSDGYIVTGFKSTSSGDRDAWVIKLDSNGTQVWDVVIAQSLDSADEARSICSTSDGNYLVAGVMGYDPDTSDSQGFIAKMDGSGNALWGHLFPSDQSDTTPYEIHDVIEDPGNGNIVVVGRIGDQLWVSALK